MNWIYRYWLQGATQPIFYCPSKLLTDINPGSWINLVGVIALSLLLWTFWRMKQISRPTYFLNEMKHARDRLENACRRLPEFKSQCEPILSSLQETDFKE